MALTNSWCDGFEYGPDYPVAGGSSAGISGSLTNPGADPGVTGVADGAFGSYALRMKNTTGGGAAINKTISGTPGKFSTFFRIKVEQNPATNAQHIAGLNLTTQGSTNGIALGLNTNGTIRLRPNRGSATGEVTGPNVNDGAWHSVEIQADISANPWSIQWWVDGVAQTTATRAVAADSVTNCVLGTASAGSETYIVRYDDWIYGTFATTADRYNNVKVLAVSPGSDGTHNTSGGATFINGDSATTPNFSNSTTTAYTYLDDFPFALARSTTDNISAETHVAGDYMELKPVAHPSGVVALCVTAWMQFSSPTTTANNGSACVIRTSAGTDIELTGAGNFTTGVDYSETTNFLKSVLVTEPAGTWTKTELDALRWRIGRASNSSDVNPRPTWQGLMTQVAYPAASTVNGTAALSATDALVVNGLRTVYGAAASVPSDILTVAGLRKVLGIGTFSPVSSGILTVAGLRKVLGSAVLTVDPVGGPGTITLDEADVASVAGGGSGGANYNFDFDTENAVAAGARAFCMVSLDTGGDQGSNNDVSLSGGGVTWNLVEDGWDGFGGQFGALFYADCPSGIAASTQIDVTNTNGTTWSWSVAMSSYISSTGWAAVGSADVNTEVASWGGSDDDWSSDTTVVTEPSLIITGISVRGATSAVPDSPSVEDTKANSGSMASLVRRIEDAGSYVNEGTVNAGGHNGMTLITQAFAATSGGAGTYLTVLGEVETPSGPTEVFGVAALAAIDVLTVAGTRRVYATTLLSAADAMVVAGRRTVLGESSASVPNALTVAGRRTVLGTSALSGQETLTILAVRKVLGTSGLAVVDALTVQGRIVSVVLGTASLVAAGVMHADGTVFHTEYGTATITIGAVLTAYGSSAPIGPRIVRGKPSSATSLTRTGFMYPMLNTRGETIFVVKQWITQVPHARWAMDVHDVTWRVTDQGLLEPV